MEQITTSTTQEVSSEERINSELQKFDFTEAAIAKLKEEYLPLKITDVNDKDGYKKVSEARKDIKKKRSSIENRRKELVEDSVKLQKAVNGRAKSLTALLLEIETPLEDQENWYEKEKERIDLEKERLEQEKIQSRINQLFSLGLAFNGNNYSIGELSIDALEIKVYNDEQFSFFLSQAKSEFEKEQAKKAEQERIEKLQTERSSALLKLNYIHDQYLGSMSDIEYVNLFEAAKAKNEEEARIKKEEADRLEKIRQGQEEERQRIEAQKKEQEEREASLIEKELALERDRKEIADQKAQMEKARIQSRTNQLLTLGFEQTKSGSLSYEELEVSATDISICTDHEWNILVNNFAGVITERKKVAEEKAIKEAEKAAKLQAEEQARLGEEAKLKQEALRPDKEKLLAVAASLEEFQFPTVASDGAEFILHNVQDELKTIAIYIRNEVRAL